MNPIFQINEAFTCTEEGKLRVQVLLEERREKYQVEARLPAREVASLLPREILVGDTVTPDRRVLEPIDELLRKLTVGRLVKVWEYSGRTYCSFLKWGALRFDEP
ncbi:MAG TPA: hypothetical protein ENN41_08225 [Sediminispirochaeta sp.]|nr:hypothetical protein [Sediminispirochaeta sp.]